MKREQLEHIIGAAATIAGYYAQGVGEETATLPDGWKDRLVPIRSKRTRGATGWCLEAHDLLIAKLFAGRDKDRRFVEAAVRHGLAAREVLKARLAATRREPELHAIVAQRIDAWCDHAS